MHNSWIVIIPPLLVLGVALVWRHVIGALAVGIVTATAIAVDFSPLTGAALVLHRFMHEAFFDTNHLYTFGFLLVLGALIQLMTHTGGLAAYTQRVLGHIKTKKSAHIASLLLSLFLFIDDYLSNLSVGSIMRPVTDRFRIPRVKLAFLVDSMSGPLCILIPATSWVAFILTTFPGEYIKDPFALYIGLIPYIFYPLFIVISAWFVSLYGISFGMMREHERCAQETGNLFGGKPPRVSTSIDHESSDRVAPESLFHFIVPIGVFLGSLVLGILYSGGARIFGGSNSLLHVLQAAQILPVLLVAGTCALASSIVGILYKSPEFLPKVGGHVLEGFLSMKNSIITLLCAWTFGALLINDLHTGSYVASTFLVSASPQILPFVLMITSLVISASIGSVWGTIAIMVPLALPMLAELDHVALAAIETAPLLLPALGAILSGSVAGSHISPVTDTMMTTSLSTGCYHMDHVQTQISYALPAIIGASVACVVTSVLVIPGHSMLIALGAIVLGIITTLGILLVRNQC